MHIREYAVLIEKRVALLQITGGLLLIERFSLNNKLHMCKPGTFSFLNRCNTVSISVCLQGWIDYVDSLRLNFIEHSCN